MASPRCRYQTDLCPVCDEPLRELDTVQSEDFRWSERRRFVPLVLPWNQPGVASPKPHNHPGADARPPPFIKSQP